METPGEKYIAGSRIWPEDYLCVIDKIAYRWDKGEPTHRAVSSAKKGEAVQCVPF